ncbi:ATP-binding protein [Streptomyces niger]|uniref:ATP-binding protein n=1 Tax=Streptomyces niger TaxID=66373 RepID=UPI001F434FBC|nr:ATP-binding protein [Streptomyces niger]
MGFKLVDASVPQARMHTRCLLTLWEWGGDVEDAALVVGELVTNAVRHGRRAGHVLFLRLAILDIGALRIDVSDPVAALPGFESDRPGRIDADDEHGRGLALVRALGADVSWFLRRNCGKTVRACLHPRPAVPAPVTGHAGGHGDRAGALR